MLSLDSVFKSTSDSYNGTIVCVEVPDIISRQLYYPSEGSIETYDYHITLAYIENLLPSQLNDIKVTLQDVSARFSRMAAKVCGLAMFDGKYEDPQIALVDCSYLNELRAELVESLEQKGVIVSRQHGFIPHMTIAYLKKGEQNPYFPETEKMTLDWTIDNIALWSGDLRWSASLK